jgi:hypothetical protein
MGASLIEFALYLVLVPIVVGIASYWLTIMSNHHMSQHLTTFIDYELACDTLARDIFAGSADPKYWKITHNCVAIKRIPDDIAWRVKDNTLWRMTGTLHVKTGVWTSKSQALMAQRVTHLQASITQRTNNIEQIQCVIQAHSGKQIVIASQPQVGRIVYEALR